jgi:hypothetical protein
VDARLKAGPDGEGATASTCQRTVTAVPGLDPGISPGHPRLADERRKDVDARLKAGHDGGVDAPHPTPHSPFATHQSPKTHAPLPLGAVRQYCRRARALSLDLISIISPSRAM